MHFYLGNGYVSSFKMLLAMLFWISSICSARLYLGVHSPMDVKGGLLLGLAIALLAGPLGGCALFDRLSDREGLEKGGGKGWKGGDVIVFPVFSSFFIDFHGFSCFFPLGTGLLV